MASLSQPQIIRPHSLVRISTTSLEVDTRRCLFNIVLECAGPGSPPVGTSSWNESLPLVAQSPGVCPGKQDIGAGTLTFPQTHLTTLECAKLKHNTRTANPFPLHSPSAFLCHPKFLLPTPKFALKACNHSVLRLLIKSFLSLESPTSKPLNFPWYFEIYFEIQKAKQ